MCASSLSDSSTCLMRFFRSFLLDEFDEIEDARSTSEDEDDVDKTSKASSSEVDRSGEDVELMEFGLDDLELRLEGLVSELGLRSSLALGEASLCGAEEVDTSTWLVSSPSWLRSRSGSRSEEVDPFMASLSSML